VSGSNRSVGTSRSTPHGQLERLVQEELKRRKAAGEDLPSGNRPEVKLTIPGFPLAPSDQ
jgi:hypothetical protein